MAIDKGVSTGDKINAVDRFLENRIGFAQTLPDRFDMDDELIEILPDFVLTKLRTEYLDSLVEDNRLTSDRYEEILAARSEAIRREEERRAREEAEARERRIRREAGDRQRAEAKIRRFGADMDAEWNVGDFIVVKQYLLDTGYDSLPIRRVYANGNNGYLALNLSDAIRVDAGNLRPTEAGDTRSVGEANKANCASHPCSAHNHGNSLALSPPEAGKPTHHNQNKANHCHSRSRSPHQPLRH